MGVQDSGDDHIPENQPDQGIDPQILNLAKALGKVPPEALSTILQSAQLSVHGSSDHRARLKVALENVQLYYNKILPRLMDRNEPSVEEIIDILVNSCVVEKNFDEAISTFAVQVHGKEIEIDQTKMRAWVEKLGNLRMYRQIIHQMGLGTFEDELISLEIQKTMGPPQPQVVSTQPTTVKAVPVPIERKSRGRR